MISDGADANLANNTDNTETYVSPGTVSLDLETQASGSTNVLMGQTGTYTVTGRNNGPVTATDVLVHTFLPKGSKVTSATSTVGACTIEGEIVICRVPSLAPNQQVVVTIQGNPSVLGEALHAWTTSKEVDAFKDNNLASLPIRVELPQLRALRGDTNKVIITWPSTTTGVNLHWTSTLSDPLVSQPVPLELITISNSLFHYIPPVNSSNQGFFLLGPTFSNVPDIQIFQQSMDLDGFIIPFSDWGRLRITFPNKKEQQYLTMVVEGETVITNLPLPNLKKEGQLQAIDVQFRLPATNSILTNVQYRYNLTTNANVPLPATTNAGIVYPLQTRLHRGFADQGLTYTRPPTVAGSTVGTSVWLGASNFPNREQMTKECGPAAIQNSLLYLNQRFNLGLTTNQLAIEAIREGLHYTDNFGLNPGLDWVNSIRTLMQDGDYRLATLTTTNMDSAMAAVRNGYDVEMEYWGHVACVLAIQKLVNGKYAVTVAHDIHQGAAGGLVHEIWLYDPSTGTVEDTAGTWSRTFRHFLIQYP